MTSRSSTPVTFVDARQEKWLSEPKLGEVSAVEERASETLFCRSLCFVTRLTLAKFSRVSLLPCPAPIAGAGSQRGNLKGMRKGGTQEN